MSYRIQKKCESRNILRLLSKLEKLASFELGDVGMTRKARKKKELGCMVLNAFKGFRRPDWWGYHIERVFSSFGLRIYYTGSGVQYVWRSVVCWRSEGNRCPSDHEEVHTVLAPQLYVRKNASQWWVSSTALRKAVYQ